MSCFAVNILGTITLENLLKIPNAFSKWRSCGWILALLNIPY